MASGEVRSFLSDQSESFDNFSLFYKIQVKIGKLLGEGKFGKVHYGQRISGAIPNLVALKSTQYNNKEGDFKKEILLLEQMDHLYIVTGFTSSQNQESAKFGQHLAASAFFTKRH